MNSIFLYKNCHFTCAPRINCLKIFYEEKLISGFKLVIYSMCSDINGRL